MEGGCSVGQRTGGAGMSGSCGTHTPGAPRTEVSVPVPDRGSGRWPPACWGEARGGVMRMDSAGQSHIGRRPHNEDAYCVLPELGLFVVADGLGGQEGGEVA